MGREEKDGEQNLKTDKKYDPSFYLLIDDG